jgi:hypothetical protein
MPGGIAEGFIHGDDAAGFHLCLADDGDGLRDFDEKSVGLGAGVRCVGNEAGVAGDVDGVGCGANIHLYGDL